MRFRFEDRDGEYEHGQEFVDFDSLEAFVYWTRAVELPRFELIPPGERYNKNCAVWLIRTHSGYD